MQCRGHGNIVALSDKGLREKLWQAIFDAVQHQARSKDPNDHLGLWAKLGWRVKSLVWFNKSLHNFVDAASTGRFWQQWPHILALFFDHARRKWSQSKIVQSSEIDVSAKIVVYLDIYLLEKNPFKRLYSKIMHSSEIDISDKICLTGKKSSMS